MKISIITLFPKMISGFFEESIVRRAIEKNLAEVEIIDLRDFAVDDYGSVDDRPYGGGAGMVMRVDVIHKALVSVIPSEVEGSLNAHSKKESRDSSTPTLTAQNDKEHKKIILTSPKGKVFNQQKAEEYAKLDHLIILAGHYEGVDERVMTMVNEEISMGDFVLTGGEIVAAAITDAVVRLLPNVLKKDAATQVESFFTVSIDQLIKTVGEDDILMKLKEKGVKKITLLEYPQYTRPEEFRGEKVPAVLLSGDPKKINRWQMKKAYEETLKKRKDLLMVY